MLTSHIYEKHMPMESAYTCMLIEDLKAGKERGLGLNHVWTKLFGGTEPSIIRAYSPKAPQSQSFSL